MSQSMITEILFSTLQGGDIFDIQIMKKAPPHKSNFSVVIKIVKNKSLQQFVP